MFEHGLLLASNLNNSKSFRYFDRFGNLHKHISYIYSYEFILPKHTTQKILGEVFKSQRRYYCASPYDFYFVYLLADIFYK